ncbi:MAG: hypothetical protein H0V60_02625, partial [Actinobacteria bacterium]|nr:hypothetical protein [Actinomycetota bacterium]
MKAKLIAAGLAVVLVAGGGAFAAMRFLGAPAEDAALALVPEDAVFYGNLFIDPSMEQKRALEGLAGRFPEVGSARNVQKGAAWLLEDPVSEAGLSFEGDVAPEGAPFVTTYTTFEAQLDNPGARSTNWTASFQTYTHPHKYA